MKLNEGVRQSGLVQSLFSQFSAAVLVASLWALLCIAPAMAQQGITPPTRDDLAPLGQTAAQPRSRITVEGDVEPAPCVLDGAEFANINVKLGTAIFNNLGPVSAAELVPSYAAYLGTEQPVSIVCRIRDAAAAILRNRGYIAAVQVPVQRIENGSVTFEVLYAKVTSIRVIGKAGQNARLLENYLGKLADGQLFNRFFAERYLLLARDIPGYDVRLSLIPATTGAGDMIAEVRLTRTPLVVDFSIQNLAAASTGRIGGQIRATFNGLTGQGDRTTLAFYSTSDFREQRPAARRAFHLCVDPARPWPEHPRCERAYAVRKRRNWLSGGAKIGRYSAGGRWL